MAGVDKLERDLGRQWVLRVGSDLSPGLRRLTICFCASCVLHAAVLAGLPRGVVRPSGLIDPGSYAPVLLQVRLDRDASNGAGEPTGSAVSDSETIPQQDPVPVPSLAHGGAETAGLPVIEEMGPPYPPPEPRYLPSSAVDVPPRLQSEIDLTGESLGDEPGAGRIVLSLLIDSHGHVDEVLVELSQLSPTFSDAAAEAFRRGRFLPATRGGTPVPSRARIEVVFGYQRQMPGQTGQ